MAINKMVVSVAVAQLVTLRETKDKKRQMIKVRYDYFSSKVLGLYRH